MRADSQVTPPSKSRGDHAHPPSGAPRSWARLWIALSALTLALILAGVFASSDVGLPTDDIGAPTPQGHAPELGVAPDPVRAVIDPRAEAEVGPGRRAVVGRVLDAESGVPIADAEVTLRDVTPAQGAILLAGNVVPSAGTGAARTDAHGFFSIDVGLTDSCELTARRDGFASDRRAIQLGADTSPIVPAGDVLLHRLVATEILIVDAEGTAFAGALAFAVAPPTDAQSGELDAYPMNAVDLDAPLARAGDDGRLRAWFDPDRGQDLVVLHAEAVPARLRPSAVAVARRAGRLELTRGVATTITVRRGDQRLPDRFEVACSLRGLQLGLRRVVPAGESVAFGALGHTSMPRERRVTVSGVGGRGAWVEQQHDFATTTHCEVHMDRVRSGRVSLRWPVAIAEGPVVVGLLGQSTVGDYLAQVEHASLADGETTLYPPWGTWRFALFCPRLGTCTSPWVKITEDDVTLQAGAWSGDVDEVTVEVRDLSGAPVPDCSVELSFGGGHADWPPPLKVVTDAARGIPQRRVPLQAAARTDQSGRCRFAGVLSGALRVFAATPAGTAQATFSIRQPHITVRLEARGSVEGRVMALALRELCAAKVRAVLQPDTPEAPSYQSPVSLDGSFRHAGVRPGAYRLLVELPPLERFRDLLVVPGPRGPRTHVLHASPLVVRADEVERVEVTASEDSLQPSLIVHLPTATDGSIELHELTGRGTSGWVYRLPFDRRDTLRLLDLSIGDWFARVHTPSGSAWTIVTRSGGATETTLAPQPPRAVRWLRPAELVGVDPLRLVPCNADGTRWLTRAAAMVAADGDHLAARDVLDGPYLLQAQRAGRWVDAARVVVRGDTAEQVRVEPR